MGVAPETFSGLAGYQLVDAIPEVAAARAVTRSAAETILAQRYQQRQQPTEVAGLPLQIDALSTARTVLALPEGTPERADRQQGLILDCSRLLQEWYRKKKPEYFEPVRHYFDSTTEEFFSHGLSINQMTSNALTPIPEDHEEESRRINEHVENATPQILRGLGHVALGGQAIRTVSECTDRAIADYKYDVLHKRPHNGYRGYVPEIEKVMIRDISLDSESLDRFEEQVGLPGTFITHEIITMTLQRHGADVSDMDKTALHGSQLLANDTLLEFVARLDAVASEQWCTEIFMGEEVTPGTLKDYIGFRREALARQKYLEDMTMTLTNYVLDLAADPSVDQRTAPAQVEEFVKILLLDVAKKDFTVAEQMFDRETAEGLQRVARLEAQGKYEAAWALQQEIREKAPGGGSCGGAACGLEEISPWSKEGQAMAKKLKAKSGDKLTKDKNRACNRCGAKSVVYAYNFQKVNKYCSSCENFSSEHKTATPDAGAD